MALEYDALNLSQGFPDFDVSRELISMVENAMAAGHNQYAPMPGIPLLQERIKGALAETYGWHGSAQEEITITAGATGALFVCITALVHKGDEVIVLEPAYDSYIPVIQLNGGITIPVSLNPFDYSIPWDFLESKITGNTRLIIINSPHNPTGSIVSASDMVRLEKLAIEHDLFVLSDEVYDRIIFDGKRHESVLRYPELAKRSMAVFSFGKTFHVTGWKTGYVVAPAYITTEIRKVHQFVNFSVNSPMQNGIAAYLENKENYNHLHEFYQKKRDKFLEMISGSRFEPISCSGTYFQMLSYAEISDENEMDMAKRLTKEFNITSIPVSPFYSKNENHKTLRFCFAKKDETLEKAGEILCKI